PGVCLYLAVVPSAVLLDLMHLLFQLIRLLAERAACLLQLAARLVPQRLGLPADVTAEFLAAIRREQQSCDRADQRAVPHSSHKLEEVAHIVGFLLLSCLSAYQSLTLLPIIKHSRVRLKKSYTGTK